MTSAADAMLQGPRGRHLCLAVAHRLHQPVWSTWLQFARHQSDAARAELVRTLGEVDTSAVLMWSDPLAFLGAMDESVSSGMGWQPPHDEDLVAADPAAIDALRPIAEAITRSAATAWWGEPVELNALRYTARYDKDFPATPPDLTGTAAKLAEWHNLQLADDRRARSTRPDDPAANTSGTWWSTPAGTGLPTTTRPLPGLGAVKLIWEEDSFGQHQALTWTLDVTRPPRVFEIDSPDAWIDLVRRYPLDVSWSRRQDWYRVTGHDSNWLIPDWEAVSNDCDAVHLTVNAYLQSATRFLALDEQTGTLLAGWDPDQTWWLTDILTKHRPEPEHWTALDDPSIPDWDWYPTPE